jgi:hypothetical protein
MAVDLSYDLELQVRAFLLAIPAVTDIVGERIFPAPAPQNTASPFVTFSRITADRNYTIYGPDKLTGGLLQIDCWSDAPEYQGSYRIAKSLGIAVRQALHGFRGMMGALRIQETTIEAERDIFEAQDHTRRVSFDFRFWYDEDGSDIGPTPPIYAGPLDKVPGAIFGYSTRKLRNAYGGAANQIRRASDPNSTTLGVGFASDGSYDAAAADAWLGAEAGFVVGWGDQSDHTLGTAWQLTTANQPSFPKVAGAYETRFAPHGPQALNAPDNANLSGLFAAGGYLLAAVDTAALAADEPAGIATKGSWTVYLYRGGGDATPSVWLIQDGTGGNGVFGTAPLALAGRHIIELEFDSSVASNVPSITVDGVFAPLAFQNGISGAAVLDTGPLEIGNSSLLASGAASFAGGLLEAFAYKGTLSPTDKATLRADVKAFYSTP